MLWVRDGAWMYLLQILWNLFCPLSSSSFRIDIFFTSVSVEENAESASLHSGHMDRQTYLLYGTAKRAVGLVHIVLMATSWDGRKGDSNLSNL